MTDESQSWGGALTAQQLGDLVGLTEEDVWGGGLTKAQLLGLISTGTGLPAGGATGRILAKQSGSDFDAAWIPVAGDSSGNLTTGGWVVGTGFRTNGLIQRNLTGSTLSGANRGLEIQTWPINTPAGWTSGATISANYIYCQSAVPTPGGGIFSAFRLLHNVLAGSGPGEVNVLHSVAALQTDLNKGSEYYSVVSQSSHAFATAAQTTSLGLKTGFNNGQPLPDNTNADPYYKGELFGGNDNARLATGALYFRNLVGREINTSIDTGASVFSRYGLLIIHKGTISAEKVDANIAMSSSAARIGIQFGLGNSNSCGVRADGTLIGGQRNLWGNAPYGQQLVAANGIDLSAFNFSESAFKSTGFNVSPAGVVDCTSGSTREIVFTVNDGPFVTLDPLNGPIQLWTLGANRTPASAMLSGQRFRLMINNGSGFTINWATLGVAWVGGSAPVLANTGWTVIDFWAVNAAIYGHHIGSVP